MSKKFDMFVERIFGATEKIFACFNAVMVTVMVSVVVLDMFSTLLKYPITVTTELTGLTFAWITGLSGILIAMRDENIALTIIKDKFKGTARRILDTVIDVMCGVFSFIMFCASWEMCISMKDLYMPLFRFPKTVLYASMFVMFGCITLVLVLKIIQRWIRGEESV